MSQSKGKELVEQGNIHLQPYNLHPPLEYWTNLNNSFFPQEPCKHDRHPNGIRPCNLQLPLGRRRPLRLRLLGPDMQTLLRNSQRPLRFLLALRPHFTLRAICPASELRRTSIHPYRSNGYRTPSTSSFVFSPQIHLQG